MNLSNWQKELRGVFKAESIDFPQLQICLERKEEPEFSSWHKAIMDAIVGQGCGFLVEGLKPPKGLNVSKIEGHQAQMKIRDFIVSHLDLYFQGMVEMLLDPKEILDTLTTYFETTIDTIMIQFSRMYYDQAVETPEGFMDRFDQLVMMIEQRHPEIMNDAFVHQTFVGAIKDTHTFQLEMSNDSGYSLLELRKMIIDEAREGERSTSLGISPAPINQDPSAYNTTQTPDYAWQTEVRGRDSSRPYRGPRRARGGRMPGTNISGRGKVHIGMANANPSFRRGLRGRRVH